MQGFTRWLNHTKTTKTRDSKVLYSKYNNLYRKLFLFIFMPFNAVKLNKLYQFQGGNIFLLGNKVLTSSAQTRHTQVDGKLFSSKRIHFFAFNLFYFSATRTSRPRFPCGTFFIFHPKIKRLWLFVSILLNCNPVNQPFVFRNINIWKRPEPLKLLVRIVLSSQLENLSNANLSFSLLFLGIVFVFGINYGN